MARVITFSRFFPAYHPKKGQETYFVEKIWKSLYDLEKSSYIPFAEHQQNLDSILYPNIDYLDTNRNIHSHKPKHHTIRNGNRWKAGDYFSPRVWSGKPYASTMITIAPNIKIEKVWDIAVNCNGDTGFVVLNGLEFPLKSVNTLALKLATNDGLSLDELIAWFNKPFNGQIICWNKEIEY